MKKNFKRSGLPFIAIGIKSEIFQQKTPKNHKRMKKLFIVLAVASLGFVACNNEGEKTPENKDTVVAPVAPTQDTIVKDTVTVKDTVPAAPAK